VINVNRQIVRCAEELVFYRDDLPWVSPFVRKNATYRLQNRTQRIPHGKETLLWSTLQVENTVS
jgi:hypothetical protein